MATYTVRINTDYSSLGKGATQATLDGYAQNLAAKLKQASGLTVTAPLDGGASARRSGDAQCVGPDDELAEQIHQAVRDIQGGDGWIDLLPEEESPA